MESDILKQEGIALTRYYSFSSGVERSVTGVASFSNNQCILNHAFAFFAIAWSCDFDARLQTFSYLKILEGNEARNFCDDSRASTLIAQVVLVHCFNVRVRSKCSSLHFS